MNSFNSDEQTSCNSLKRQENGDASSTTERPLKKARFAWQVKGRHHLTNETSENRATSNTPEQSCSSSENVNENSKDLTGNVGRGLQIIRDYLLKKDYNTSDSLSEPETSTNTSNSTEALNVSIDNISASEDQYFTEDFSDFYEEDESIARWQERQMAKCFVDNTINRALDNWMITPLHHPADMDNNRLVALDVADMFNYLPRDNDSIENEGILMAISAHGLQNTSSLSNSSSDYVPNCNKDMPPSPSSSIHFEDDPTPDCIKESKICNTGKELASWPNVEEANEDPPLTYNPYLSSSFQYSSENTSTEFYMSCNDDDTINNHYLLDAAVCFAINTKGLTCSLGRGG